MVLWWKEGKEGGMPVAHASIFGSKFSFNVIESKRRFRHISPSLFHLLFKGPCGRREGRREGGREAS